jgi:NAD(P)-dependent dehydrogenase (short-subunit alcohol dehydrogenase family)
MKITRKKTPYKTVLELFRLDNCRAVVTGGARGIGRVIVRAFAEAGADVILSDREVLECQAVADEISSATGRRIIAVAADITKPRDVERLAEMAESSIGPINILVNNAGIITRDRIETLSLADWDEVIATNLTGPFLCARAFGPAMCHFGWGRIINIGSIFSVCGFPGRIPYASSKAGLLNFARALALEWAPTGVTVNTICPGVFPTDMNKHIPNDPTRYAALLEKIPMARLGEMNELAGAAVFLASDAASYITGSAIFVDGGWTAQ